MHSYKSHVILYANHQEKLYIAGIFMYVSNKLLQISYYNIF